MHIFDFIDECLEILGLQGEEAQLYRAKILTAAAGKALLEIESDPENNRALAEALETAGQKEEGFEDALLSAFPDERHMYILAKNVIDVLLHTAAQSVDEKDVETVRALTVLIRRVLIEERTGQKEENVSK